MVRDEDASHATCGIEQHAPAVTDTIHAAGDVGNLASLRESCLAGQTTGSSQASTQVCWDRPCYLLACSLENELDLAHQFGSHTACSCVSCVTSAAHALLVLKGMTAVCPSGNP